MRINFPNEKIFPKTYHFMRNKFPQKLYYSPIYRKFFIFYSNSSFEAILLYARFVNYFPKKYAIMLTFFGLQKSLYLPIYQRITYVF